jgi:hypothetical protein
MVQAYNVYVGQIANPSSLTKIASVSPIPDNMNPGNTGKVIYVADIALVQATLSISSTLNFSNLLLYWAITYVDDTGTESDINSSRVVEVPPVGVYGKTMKEDPTINRHGYVFSDDLQSWIKMAGSDCGATVIDACDLYKTNTITKYGRDNSGNILTELIYWSDRTSTGSPAKLITYSYDNNLVSQIVVSDSTVS